MGAGNSKKHNRLKKYDYHLSFDTLPYNYVQRKAQNELQDSLAIRSSSKRNFSLPPPLTRLRPLAMPAVATPKYLIRKPLALPPPPSLQSPQPQPKVQLQQPLASLPPRPSYVQYQNVAPNVQYKNVVPNVHYRNQPPPQIQYKNSASRPMTLRLKPIPPALQTLHDARLADPAFTNNPYGTFRLNIYSTRRLRQATVLPPAYVDSIVIPERKSRFIGNRRPLNPNLFNTHVPTETNVTQSITQTITIDDENGTDETLEDTTESEKIFETTLDTQSQLRQSIVSQYSTYDTEPSLLTASIISVNTEVITKNIAIEHPVESSLANYGRSTIGSLGHARGPTIMFF